MPNANVLLPSEQLCYELVNGCEIASGDETSIVLVLK